MIITSGILLTAAIQIGASFFNQRFNKKNSSELRRLQQEFKKEVQERSLRRDYDKFRRCCEFQLQMEEESHEQRLIDIDNEFNDWFAKMAHADALASSHYPLNISPYIIKSAVIPFCYNEVGMRRKEVFCILTNSNDPVFNKSVIPHLDAMISDVICSAWNQKGTHTLCYYTDIWRQDALFSNDFVDNIKTILKTPTMAVTPFFEKREQQYALTIMVNMWEDTIVDKCVCLETGISYDKMPTAYTKETANELLAKLLPIMMCGIGISTDVYYWSNYYLPPLLPSLLSKGLVKVTQDEYVELGKTYEELFTALALGTIPANCPCVIDKSRMSDIAGINQFNFPERAVGFLEEASKISPSPQNAEKMIEGTLFSLYQAKTDMNFESKEEIDVTLLDKGDMDQITRLISIAKSSQNLQLKKDLTDIVRRKILSSPCNS